MKREIITEYSNSIVSDKFPDANFKASETDSGSLVFPKAYIEDFNFWGEYQLYFMSEVKMATIIVRDGRAL